MYGLLTQWGPRVFSAKTKRLEDNLANLNQKFNLIVLDQPVKVGWSYHPNNEQDTVGRSEHAAEDVFQFLLAFKRKVWSDNRNYRSNTLHVTGESFAGHYVPFIAERIAQSTPAEQDVLQLRTIVIGNGWFDRQVHLQATYEYVCDKARSPFPAYLLSQSDCDTWKKVLDGQCMRVITRCLNVGENCAEVGPLCGQCSASKYMQVGRQ